MSRFEGRFHGRFHSRFEGRFGPGRGGSTRDATPPDLALFAPPGFGWDFVKYPLQGQKVNGVWEIATDPKSLVNLAIWYGPIYYVRPGVGSDSNTGLGSYANALATVNKAVELGNATFAPYRVYVYGSGDPTYTRGQAIIAAAVRAPTQHCAIISDGGRATIGTHDSLTWTLQSGTTYQATRSAVQRVFDRLNQDAWGNYQELAKVADLATCQSTPGSWAQVSSTLYVNRADGAAVSNSNTRAYVTSDCFNFGTDVNADIYLEGFDLEGGALGTISMSGGARNLVMVDVNTRNSGSIASQTNGIRHLNVTGLCAAFRCSWVGHLQDGLNGTWNVGGTVAGYYLTVDCIGKGNGYAGSNDNGLTIHDGLKGIDINGAYEGNLGPNVAIAGTGTQMWCASTQTKDSAGTPPNASEYITDGGEFWLEDTAAETAGVDLAAVNNASIHTRNHQTIGGGTNSIESGSTLDAF